jgi:hypothetical protein
MFLCIASVSSVGKGKRAKWRECLPLLFFFVFCAFSAVICFSASTDSPFDVYSFSFSLLHSCCSEYPSHSISLLHVSFICDVIVCLLSVVQPPLKHSLSLTTRSPYNNDHAAVGNLSPSCIERLSSCILDHRVLVS